MNTYISDISSVHLLRQARGRRWPRLEECHDRTVADSGASRRQWWRESIPELEPLMTIDSRHPLHIHVSCDSQRVRSDTIACDVLSPVLPDGAFLLAILNQMGTSVKIDAGPLSFVQLAHKLERMVRTGTLSYAQARALLIDFGMEVTGSYVRDPFASASGGCHFSVRPVTCSADMQSWCRGAHHVRGVRFARRIARDVMDASRSPMETLHAIVLSSSPELGGLGLGAPLINEPLHLNRQQHRLLQRSRITPDLYFPDLGFAIEHQGGGHGTSAQYAEDAYRTQVYAALGIRLFETSRLDVQTPAAYDRFLQRLTYRIATDHGTRLGSRLREILDDPALHRLRWKVIDALVDRSIDPWSQ